MPMSARYPDILLYLNGKRSVVLLFSSLLLRDTSKTKQGVRTPAEGQLILSGTVRTQTTRKMTLNVYKVVQSRPQRRF